MILVFYALRHELGAIRKRVARRAALSDGLAGFTGSLGGERIAFVATGVGMARAQESARRALRAFAHPRLVISTGVAGGLAPQLKAGDLVIAQRLLIESGGGYDEAGRIAPATLELVRQALERRHLNAAVGTTLSVPRVLSTAAAKRGAYVRSGALAVDMESAAIALAAAACGAPFVCLRAIIDEAADDLPASELAGESGHVSKLKAAAFLLKHPRVLARMPSVVKNLRLATASIGSALEALCAACD